MKRILVADDNAVSRELVREILEPRGYDIIEASDGRQTLDEVLRSAPDLLLLDIEMPVLDGFGVVGRLRADPRFAALPVLALTAYAMRGDCEKALAAGFTGYITKPLDARSLRDSVARLLGE